MDGQIVSVESIQAKARAAANQRNNINAANPYPLLTAAHALWELSYRLAMAGAV